MEGAPRNMTDDGTVTQHDQTSLTVGPDEDPQHAVPDSAASGRDRRCPRRRRRRRLVAWVVVAAVVISALAAAALVPINKVIESPGPTWNVLGSENGEDLLTVSGATIYETDGALRMTTVAVRGCPGYPVTVLDVVVAAFRSDQRVLDRDAVCPESMTAEEVDQASQAQMTSSQDSAVGAALMETGAAITQTLTVAGTAPDLNGAAVQTGDILTSVTPQGAETTAVTTYAQLRDLMSTVAPGTSVTLGLTRNGEEIEATLTTQEPPDADRSGSVLGLYLSVTADSLADATFGLTDVGGPSAGMMFALGIVDEMTPGSMTGGQDVAGTGTIDVTGAVGAIGGIAQKMAGAEDAGSDYFLAPASNCADVVGNEPDGMKVFAVSTLHEAVEATEAIADGDTAQLTTCEMVQATASSAS